MELSNLRPAEGSKHSDNFFIKKIYFDEYRTWFWKR